MPIPATISQAIAFIQSALPAVGRMPPNRGFPGGKSLGRAARSPPIIQEERGTRRQGPETGRGLGVGLLGHGRQPLRLRAVRRPVQSAVEYDASEADVGEQIEDFATG